MVNLRESLPKRGAAAVAAEGRRFLRFSATDAETHEVRFETAFET